MLNFLRKLRRREMKGANYLKYALGEILLVMIGILLALAINNWNENRKGRIKEVSLLENIARELTTDIKQIRDNQDSVMQRRARMNTALRMLEKPEKINKIKFVQMMSPLDFNSYFTCNSGIFDEAVSSGKMSLVQNEKLLENIFNYYRVAKANYQDHTTRKVADEMIAPALLEYLMVNKDILPIFDQSLAQVANLEGLDINALKSDPGFWKMVTIKDAYISQQVRNWQQLAVRAKALKDAIDVELKRLK